MLLTFRPGDAGYDAEVASFNTASTPTPARVVAVQSAADVAAAIRLALEEAWPVFVQGAGHGGLARVDSGLLISTRRLSRVSIDPTAGTATVGAGARWSAVISAAAEHGLVPNAGSSPLVGVAGYLMGGGLGPLARSHGYGSDFLVSARVVSGEGESLHAAPDGDGELLWALRGGKVGLGVVTELTVRLLPLRTLYAGALFFSEEHIEAALRSWLAWTAEADPRVSTSAAIIRFPPFNTVPEPLRGRRLLSLRFAFPGKASEGESLAAPLRKLAPIHLDQLGELPASQMARIHSDPTDPAPLWMSGAFLNQGDSALASALLKLAGAGTDSPFAGVELRHLGSAAARDVPEGSAVGGRSAHFSLSLFCVNPALFDATAPAAWGRLRKTLEGGHLAPETNVNFMPDPRSAAQFASAWPPEIFRRLETVRRRVDPAGVLMAGLPFGENSL